MEGYRIENFGKKSTFASFLPGVVGVRGIPLWCFYVNRGQGVVSFGVNGKQDSIMEFYPAHQAYQNVKTTGFRSFIKIDDGPVIEPFSDEELPSGMEIGMNTLELEEQNAQSGLKLKVCYFILPEEPIGALVRTVTVSNTSTAPAEIELVDGMPALIPCGVDLARIKEIGQTAKAWMQVEDTSAKTPYYRTRASLADSAEVAAVESGNYALGYDEAGSLLPVIVDPALVFDYDTSLRRPVGLEGKLLKDVLSTEQVTANNMPCAFFARTLFLLPGESRTVYELYGRVQSKRELQAFLTKKRDAKYFEAKKARAVSLTEDLTQAIATRTASKAFDSYCRVTYLDNVLRGGYPIRLGTDKVFYTYSRKHGDLERDYNDFSLLPEYYTQGNGHFRDVNQNRRCDVFFAPFVCRENIRKFYSLIQLDGYNPLNIERQTYRIAREDALKICGEKAQAEALSEKPFTPGVLYRLLEHDAAADTIFRQIMDAAEPVVGDCFGDGYWTDHWTYNLDLIEDYLEVYPEQEKDLLYARELSCYLAQAKINPREKRYVETDRGLRQYHALDEASRRDGSEKLVHTAQGDVLRMSLLEKLVILCAVKFAALDAYGMGLEMEGGKPGWYDALNGLPGMLGSSMNESYELCRMLVFTVEALKRQGEALEVLSEAAELLRDLDEINRDEAEALHRCDPETEAEAVRAKGQVLDFWNRINDRKEAYRDTTYVGVAGTSVRFEAEELAAILQGFADTVRSGIHKARVLGKGGIPSYFAYEVPEYVLTEKGIKPLRFVPVETPPFLEGAVRYLKLPLGEEEKRDVYRRVKSSELYDRELRMYKVNASLRSASYELGRSVAFTPGWLENESIWLHMEYKYLLELIRNGLYEEFFEDFQSAAVPFLDPDIYGRSIYENSSFLVSSAYPNKALHGKGFVARLSGSTVEFLSIWKRMMFGPQVLSVQDGVLCFTPRPAMPRYLIPKSGEGSAMLFGKTKLRYHFAQSRDYIPGNYEIRSMRFTYEDGSLAECPGDRAVGSVPTDLREGRIRTVDIDIV